MANFANSRTSATCAFGALFVQLSGSQPLRFEAHFRDSQAQWSPAQQQSLQWIIILFQ